MSQICQLTTLVASPHFSIDYCETCALFHLNVGSITLRLSEAEFMHWTQGLSQAQQRYFHTQTQCHQSTPLM